MDLYVCAHHHECGVSFGLIRSDHQPGEDEIVRALGWDFEAEKGEWIVMDKYDEADIKTLPPTVR